MFPCPSITLPGQTYRYFHVYRPFMDSDDEDYDEKKFQDDNSDEDTQMYQAKPDDDDDEEDELDMFMKGIEV